MMTYSEITKDIKNIERIYGNPLLKAPIKETAISFFVILGSVALACDFTSNKEVDKPLSINESPRLIITQKAPAQKDTGRQNGGN